jgi:DNA-binding NtrC family response regulator
MPQAILIVMEDVLFSQTLRHKLSRFGVKVFITETPVQALELLGMKKMDVVLLDVRGNNLPAVRFLRELRKLSTEVETILISSYDDVAVAIECVREGASDEITVPFDIESLKTKVKEAVKRSRLRQKQKKGKLGLLDSFQQAMVAATFAQGGEFDSARTILNENNDDHKIESNKEIGKPGRKTED